MSTWQILPDGVNCFCWEQQLTDEPIKLFSPSDSFLLPSMPDLLLQGKSVTMKHSSITKALSIPDDKHDSYANTGWLNLIENHQENFQNLPMFPNVLGKTMGMRQSSITKASSILGNEDEATSKNPGNLCNGSDSGYSCSNSVFQTGSGKKVNISSAGLVKARTLLGLQEYSDCDNTFGTEQSKNQSKELIGWPKSVLESKEETNASSYGEATTPPLPTLKVENRLFHSVIKSKSTINRINSDNKCPPIKFQSASGRSISVSNAALQRAKSLLGDLEHGSLFGEEDATYLSSLFVKQGGVSHNNPDKKYSSISTPNRLGTDMNRHMVKGFVSPSQPVSNQSSPSPVSEKLNLRNNLIEKFDAEDQKSVHKTANTHIHQKIWNGRPIPHIQLNNHLGNPSQGKCSSDVPLVDFSNTLGMAHKDGNLNGGLKRNAEMSSVFPFKKPCNSRYITPLENGVPAPNAIEESYARRRIFTHYPFQNQRKYMEDYFDLYPLDKKPLKKLPDHVMRMSPEKAEKYLFPDAFGVECIGAEAFYYMLTQSGASTKYLSKKWVANHYKWIVWKLACYERNWPCKASGKLFTMNNVLQELKLRYEREVNHGHRSAIKRILEGDQPPSSELVLCISSIYSTNDETPLTLPMPSYNFEPRVTTMVEVTDGWYSVNAFLDVHLLKNLAAGKLFVGQKLRIQGAGLCGWAGPISPLEVICCFMVFTNHRLESSMVGLSLHINGTYRAHWANRLGLCKYTMIAGSVPLAFRCIKAMGGPVHCTLVGVTRIYPLQYRERLSSGGCVVRSGMMEAKIVQLYNQRRSAVAEGIMSEFQNEIKIHNFKNDSDSEEGAKILNILETAAEPELIMAGMTPEQLSVFSSYNAKVEEIRQSDMRKSIEKAFEAAGLSARDVTPFMRVRVVGLISKNSPPKSCNLREGIITIWNPCDKQQSELSEGKAYAVTSLIPLNLDADSLYLQARGSTTKWVPLSSSSMDNFQPFYSPRRPVSLSHLCDVPLSSEFDIAAFVIYVGDVYTDGHQKKQWLFVADGSISESRLAEPPKSLLAISFCSSCVDCESLEPVSHNLVGSAVGFCNLVKRAMDQTNHIWVAEATANSTYFLSSDGLYGSHLKEAATSAERWARTSSSKIKKLRQKVLGIVGNNKG